MGNVNASASAKNAQAASHLPRIACPGVTADVNSNSIVPSRRSSAHRRMATAGTKIR